MEFSARSSWIFLDTAEAEALWRPLSLRLLWVKSSLEWEQIFQKELESSGDEKRATQFADSKIVVDICLDENGSWNDAQIGTVIRDQDKRRIYGARWKQLIELVNSPEILLILDLDEELGDDMIDICEVIRDGDDKEFESVKDLLLRTDFGFGKVCHLLSGTVEMIQRLHGLGQDSDLRKFLVHSITQKVRHALGRLQDETSESEEDEDQEEVDDKGDDDEQDDRGQERRGEVNEQRLTSGVESVWNNGLDHMEMQWTNLSTDFAPEQDILDPSIFSHIAGTGF
jgi:hypothetical protein